ncbi:wnt inhibitory factor 1-like [Plakobranchus ocellatus]|uniref:Wnt inhibitory factor 1-like n=1 Tax=Plakobranchus ocellatus TaxID=259542 RepID=A0AAV4DIH3_9GAST|nr:wnt inhibitory factor 1-like [Plakobranchus ocellatus]
MYVFENFTSLDQHLLYQPLLGIPATGYIPSRATDFQITIPCKGKEKGVASLSLGLQIYDRHHRLLRGTPIKFRLRKQCEAFVTSSLCKQGCRNGGTCNPHGVCECPQGFRGPLCDIALCNPPCQNNGTCISPSKCACPPGYKGAFCEKAVCGRMCQNGGHCLPEGYCWCNHGFFGDACEYSRCNPRCQNGGTCTRDHKCVCSAQYSGQYCEIKDDTERPRRSKEPDSTITNKVVRKPKRVAGGRKKGRKNLEAKLRKAEQRLLKITARRARKWRLSPEDQRMVSKLTLKAETESLTLRERRYVIKLLTRMRSILTSKDKTKLLRFRKLIRKWKRGPKRSKRKKRLKKTRKPVK